MEIFTGVEELRGSPAEIPDCSRRDLPRFFEKMGYKTGAEIGVRDGKFTLRFCRRGFKMYAIDPWTVYDDYSQAYKDSGPSQEGQDIYYAEAKKRLGPFANCEIIRKTSMDAASDFDDESLDFVYIDGHHGFKYVAEDLWEWHRRVRTGGAVCGHDYVYYKLGKRHPYSPDSCHVTQAVDGFTSAFEIENWYLLGRKRKVSGEKRDKFRSWLWIKE